MDTGRSKKTAQWFYSNVFQEEAIAPRAAAPTEQLPSLLRTARSLESGLHHQWQTRDAIFLKQAKLLVSYEDDYAFSKDVVRYYPTYQSLSDQELRGYFSWRTKLRKGSLYKTSLSFAFLYIYELLNGIGVNGPVEGYEKLQTFRTQYGTLDERVLPYLNQWLEDYVVYYGLDPKLLADTPQGILQRHIATLEQIALQSDTAIVKATRELAPKWLNRSKFYAAHQADCDEVIAAVLRRVSNHYENTCKKTFVEQYFGLCREIPVQLFPSAVFCDPEKRKHWEYAIDPSWVYRCQNSLWSVKKRNLPQKSRMEDLLKTIDGVMRQEYGASPIQCPVDTKWLLAIIREETNALCARKKAAEKNRITIDFSRLSAIRRDADMTREKLLTEEEMEEETPHDVIPPNVETLPLGDGEYRLLQCLLYDRPLTWVQAEGHLLSVLTDKINESLFDHFGDCVLDDSPALIDDYIDELKEMVFP